jgi:hypothetical protein
MMRKLLLSFAVLGTLGVAAMPGQAEAAIVQPAALQSAVSADLVQPVQYAYGRGEARRREAIRRREYRRRAARRYRRY